MFKQNNYPDRKRNNIRRYGITLEDYNKLLQQQNGVCKICRNPETLTIKGKTLNLAIDHCHTTNKVRGLLCHSCNQGLGRFKDDPNLLKQAINYLNT